MQAGAESSREAHKPVHPVGQHVHSFKASRPAQIAAIQKKFKVCHLQNSPRLGVIARVGTGSSLAVLKIRVGHTQLCKSFSSSLPTNSEGERNAVNQLCLQKTTHIVNGNKRLLGREGKMGRAERAQVLPGYQNTKLSSEKGAASTFLK